MKLSVGSKKELLRQAKSRSNRRACRAAREATRCRTFDEFIAFLDDVQSLHPAGHCVHPFVPYRFVPI
jgi:hypothetical protein